MSQDLNIPQGTFLGHPKGLYLLFATEMWERFSFYGMRALLVLYAAAATHAVNPGLGWADAQALKLYGWYLGLVYLTPIIGGWIADRFFGYRKAVFVGGLFMAAGEFTLMLSDQRIASSSGLGSHHRQRLLQAEHLDDGRQALPAGRRRAATAASPSSTWASTSAPSSRRSSARPSARTYGWAGATASGRRHRHAAFGDHPARLRAALHRQRRARAGGEALAADVGRRQAAEGDRP